MTAKHLNKTSALADQRFQQLMMISESPHIYLATSAKGAEARVSILKERLNQNIVGRSTYSVWKAAKNHSANCSKLRS